MFSKAVKQYIEQNNFPHFDVQAVFFDMDGVLFDSMPHHAQAWVKAMSEINIDFSLYEAYLHEGRTGSSTIDGAFQRTLGRDATESEKQKIYSAKTRYFEDLGEVFPMPFAHELLTKIKRRGIEIYLVTGSGTATLLDNLNASFPDIFVPERMVTAFDVIEGKPSPEPYLMALQKSGLQRWQVCVVENAPLGVKSANAAGLFTIAVNTGILKDEDLSANGANIVLPSIESLNNCWEKFNKLYVLQK
ncbi:MAG: HAD hydrolase-like protein [Paludibacter sp.]|jgi:HAD superfamily hydrolase (TIGR01509 family)|nr:HAD hydrolase-like protein [Paludibacter sp.]